MQEIDLNKFVLDVTLGYYYIYLPKHELANGSGKVYMHRYVAAMKLGRPLATDEHVHHIDGNRANNSIENLEVLSATEHAKQHAQEKYPTQLVFCSQCGEQFACTYSRMKRSKSGNLFCSEECNKTFARRFELDRDILFDLVWTYPTVKVADILGVSDVAIGKRCKKLNVPKPPRGYWRKLERGFEVQKSTLPIEEELNNVQHNSYNIKRCS